VTNNDILRRLRYTFDFSNQKMQAILGLTNHKATKEHIIDWLKKEDEPGFRECSDTALSAFLDGLIIERRGRQDGEPAKPVSRINNNIVFRKLKIALDLKAEDVLSILALAETEISKHELSAFFRKPGHKNYRGCNDQILRNFLNGMQVKYRASQR